MTVRESILRDIECAESLIRRIERAAAELRDSSLSESTEVAVMGLHAWISDATDLALDHQGRVLEAA